MITIIITGVIALIVGFVLGYLLINITLKYRSKNIIKEAEAEAEVIKKDKILQAKEKFLQIKAEHEKQVNARNSKILLAENKLKQKDAELARKMEECQRKIKDAETQQETLEAQKELLEKKHSELDKFKKQQIEQLEAISGMSADQAKEKLISSLKDEAETEAMSYVNEIMEEAKMTANMEAKKIVVKTIQRVATETATENAVSIFHIDSDEIKGRIIGREGRNIRALETITGVDLIIDDTPEAITLSSFDPVRREIARVSLEKLITDGRLHPARIEETVDKARREVEATIKQAGERAVVDAGVNGVHPELVKLLGKLKYRTSYGQNVLNHSLEVSYIAGLMASEIGADIKTARRAGLLHDIGKALDHEFDGSHVELGVEYAKRFRENEAVVHAIQAHHGDVEPKTIVACLVQAADAISAARPGARRENVQNYIKRLEKLEEIANSFEGVDRSFAIQAGREVRIMVKPEVITDDKMTLIAREIVKKIESELEYPGQIKVNIIRENRAVDYAK